MYRPKGSGDSVPICILCCTYRFQPTCTKQSPYLSVSPAMRQREEGSICTESEKVEHGSFTTLAFAATGGMGKAVTITYAHIASLIAIKTGQPYSQVLGWLCCMLSFSLKRPALMCFRGTCGPFCARVPSLN